jgi:hypothetical protein
METAKSIIKGVFTQRIDQRMDYLSKLSDLTEKLLTQADAGEQERVALLIGERQRIINRLKTCDQEDFRLIESTKINFEDYPELLDRLEQINRISSSIKSMEVKVRKSLDSGLANIAGEMKNAKIGRATGNAYTAETRPQPTSRLDAKL